MIGNNYEYTRHGEKVKGNRDFLERVGTVEHESEEGQSCANLIKEGLNFHSELYNPNFKYSEFITNPMRKELRPNMKCTAYDGVYAREKYDTAKDIGELTLLKYVTPDRRDACIEKHNIQSIYNNNLEPEHLGFHNTNSKHYKELSSIITVNKSTNKSLIIPKRIQCNYKNWKQTFGIEFVVDFETIDVHIFMIGVYHYIPRSNTCGYKTFIANSLTPSDEKSMCNDFENYIVSMNKLHGDGSIPKCLHWSSKEPSDWNRVSTYPTGKWIWFDVLKLFEDNTIAVKGCYNHKLKHIAKSMKTHGFINTIWGSFCKDGMDAACLAREAYDSDNPKEHQYMKHIVEYNKIDVKVVHEIITYLRNHHA